MPEFTYAPSRDVASQSNYTIENNTIILTVGMPECTIGTEENHANLQRHRHF